MLIHTKDDEKSRDNKTRHEMNAVEAQRENKKHDDLSTARKTAVEARQQPGHHSPTPRTKRPEPDRGGNAIPEADYPVSPFGE